MKYSRLYRIAAVFRAYRLNELLPQNSYCKWLKITSYFLFWIPPKAKNKPIGERLRLALQELGPIWVKFGQMLSTRRDILPESVAEQLTLLQDKVDPFDGKIAKNIIEQALGEPIEALFDNFELIPLASASIAQVHAARLKRSQSDIIIKVLRPNILFSIQADISLMYWVADKVEHYMAGGEKLRARDIVRDYEKTILNELDLLQEAENTKRLRENFLDSDLLYIPYVNLSLCRKNILIEERIYGVPISNITQLKENNVNLKLLAEKGVQAFFTQVFRDNFFHADMHPGNIFVDITDPQEPRYIGIDCSIVGELTSEDQYYLAENFIAFFNRDYRKIASLYIDSGWVPHDTDINEFERAMRDICEPVFEKPLGDISFAQVLFNLFKVARQFNMEIQPQLVLLEKTMFYIEGLGRQLYPELDLWTTAKPFLEQWYKERMGAKYFSKRIIDNLPLWQKLLPELPERIYQQEKDNRLLKSKLDHLSQQLYTFQKRQRNLSYIILSAVTISVLLSVFL